MSKACCDSKSDDLKFLRAGQKRVLWIVLVVNAVMFLVEYSWGLWANSQALMADSLDMLGDAMAYASTLFVVERGAGAKIKASQFKAWLMIVLGLSVVLKAIYHFMAPQLPHQNSMLALAVIALVANAYCLWLLTRHKNDDLNFRSVWICSRNDIIANLAVILAAILVGYFSSAWPDLIIGLGIAILFIKSAIGILQEAKREH